MADILGMQNEEPVESPDETKGSHISIGFCNNSYVSVGFCQVRR